MVFHPGGGCPAKLQLEPNPDELWASRGFLRRERVPQQALLVGPRLPGPDIQATTGSQQHCLSSARDDLGNPAPEMFTLSSQNAAVGACLSCSRPLTLAWLGSLREPKGPP